MRVEANCRKINCRFCSFHAEIDNILGVKKFFFLFFKTIQLESGLECKKLVFFENKFFEF